MNHEARLLRGFRPASGHDRGRSLQIRENPNLLTGGFETAPRFLGRQLEAYRWCYLRHVCT